MDALLFHPKVVHIPIALAVLMPLLSGGLLLAWWRGWLPRRTWWVAVGLQALLVGSSFAAMQSGEADEDRVEAVVSHEAIHAHEELAEGFMWATVAALVIFTTAGLVPREGWARSAAGVALVASVGVFWMGVQVGQAGGELVYKHGAASAYTQPQAVIPHATDRDHDSDD